MGKANSEIDELRKCPHRDGEMFAFNAPYVGVVLVCWDCRRELAIRTLQKPMMSGPLDCGRFGFNCKKCRGEYTSTDVMTCKCPDRKKYCAANAKASREWSKYAELVIWRPKKNRSLSMGKAKG